MKKILSLVLLSGIILSTGCSNAVKEYKPEPKKAVIDESLYVSTFETDKVLKDAFANAAETAAKAQLILAQNDTALKAGDMSYETIREANWRAKYTPEGLERPISITWDGPVMPLVSQLSHLVDYEVRIPNDIAPIPAIVSLDVKNETIINVFRRIDSQVGNMVDIDIYDQAKVIEVKYVD